MKSRDSVWGMLEKEFCTYLWAASARSAGVACVLTMILSVSVNAGPWRGRIIKREGTTYVMNPSSPSKNEIALSANKLWEVGNNDEEEFFFGVVSGITSDSKGMVYVLDAQLNQVLIFSEDGEYLRTIGREGEGPGEFRRPSDIFLTPEGNVAVIQRAPGKIVILSTQGEPLGDYPVPIAEGGGIQMIVGGKRSGENIVLFTQRFMRLDTGMNMAYLLTSINTEGKKVADFTRREDSHDFAKLVFDEKSSGPNAIIWEAGADGRVYISDDFDAYKIEVWNADGIMDRIIEREYEHRVRTDEDMKLFQPRARVRRNGRAQNVQVNTSKTDRDILQLFSGKEDKLWVLSSRGAFAVPEDVIAVFDIFDGEGRFIKRVRIKGKGDYRQDGYYIDKDRLYVVRGLRSARMAMFNVAEGVGGEDETPVSVACYDLSPYFRK